MHVTDTEVILSASDVVQAGVCEFAFLRKLDAALNRDVEVPELVDSMLERTSRLGDVHEEQQLERYRIAHPGQVAEIARPIAYNPDGLRERVHETVQALLGDHRIVFQATFYDPDIASASHEHAPQISFAGFADFLERVDSPDDHSDGARVWQVQDTKLARTARVTALIQVAAYAEQLEKLGVEVHESIALILGDGSRSYHRLADISPVFRSRRDRTIELVVESWARSATTITEWNAEGVAACGRCEVCAPEVERFRDVLLVAGLSLSQRARLHRAGIDTIDDLAAIAGTIEPPRVPGLSAVVLDKLATQAELQVRSETQSVPAVAVRDAEVFRRLPRPSPGDLFFDFEGDPLFHEHTPGHAPRWGLDYLFGMIDSDERYTALWAHTLEEEKHALEAFLDLVHERRARFPDLRIYHYAPYEKTHLLSIAARHGTREAEVDDLLREHVLVDLYPIVKQALTVGSRSYSIKKLEPLYMGDEFRDEDGVTDGAQSVVEYAIAAEQLHSEDPAVRQEGETKLEALADYNRYDCVSTLRLRDWLLELAREHGTSAEPATGTTDETVETEQVRVFEEHPTGVALEALAEAAMDPAEAQSLRMAASAIDYYQREHKSFWWEHYARLELPVEDWADTRNVFVVQPERSRVLEEWHVPARARTQQRLLALRGQLAPGSHLSAGRQIFAVYETAASQPRIAVNVTLESVESDTLVVREKIPKDAEPRDVLPLALTPEAPPNTDSQKGAITWWGDELRAALEQGGQPNDPVFDVLRRTTPRFRDGGEPEPVRDHDVVTAVTDSLTRLDRSYLAVQGPPGTGKTYLASHVMKRLVEQYGWRIGVVAQSHRVVENVLDGVVRAGLSPEAVGKVPQPGAKDADAVPEWSVLGKDGHQAFLAERAERGAVIGGTAWDFSNLKRFDRGALDLLVVDEAGQFSLAPTIASSVAAERLLLLGDPQQLPQVSQGSHPEPVDESALGWLIDGRDTLPRSLGYFLAETRRMHPALADIDSQLSYAGRLTAHPTTLERVFTGIGDPGLVWHPVSHTGNATFAPEEATRVVEIVTGVLAEATLTVDDVIVVAAYNAQVECVQEALAAAGVYGVRVGTVDRFQGQEAAVSVVTLAASSPEEVPRGLDFLLMRNRLNVGISRAQWVTHLVSSPQLGGTGIPKSVSEVHALAGYLLLTELGGRSARYP